MTTGHSGTAALFRALAHSRKSANRFQTGRFIPAETLRDVLESTLVRNNNNKASLVIVLGNLHTHACAIQCNSERRRASIYSQLK